MKYLKYLKLYETYVNDKKITITYQTTTPESLEDVDFSDSGWYDKDGKSMIPDKYEEEDGIVAVDKAIEFLKNNWADEPSSSYFHQGIWYSTPDPEQNYSTGENTYYSYHLEGFTEEEEYEIWKIMTNYEEKQLKKTTDKYNL